MTPLSEHETETLIRESLDHLAARAPDGNDVRNALARAGQRRPRARLALVAAAAAVVAIAGGIAVGAQVLTSSDDPAATSEAAAAGLVLGYTPGSLPDGFTEQYRESGPGTAPQVRRWFAGAAEITLSAYSTADPEWSGTALKIASIADQVVVHGRVAMVTGDTGTAALLTWMADDRRVLTVQVSGVPDARAVAQDIAASVSAEPVVIGGELRFGPLPAGARLLSTTVRGSSPGDGSTEVKAYDPVRPSVPVLRATVSAGSPGVGGATAVTVRGGAGYFVAPKGADPAMVAVKLPSGRWLTVSGTVGEDALIAVADGIRLDGSPDYRWLGRATS